MSTRLSTEELDAIEWRFAVAPDSSVDADFARLVAEVRASWADVEHFKEWRARVDGEIPALRSRAEAAERESERARRALRDLTAACEEPHHILHSEARSTFNNAMAAARAVLSENRTEKAVES